MNTVIDFSGASSYWEVHSILIEALSLPSYYGRNLDALHDCLTEIGSPDSPVAVRITGADKASENMSRYMIGIRRVFEDSAEENPWLNVEFD